MSWWRADELDDLGLGHDLVVAPRLVGVEGHELDEPDDDALVATPADEVEDLVVVDALHDHAVDLDRLEPGLDGGVDAVEHLVELVATGELDEAVAVEGVEADVDALQARGAQIVGHQAQRGAVGGDGQVDAELRELADQHRAGAPAPSARRR